jgi:hypothetical protein
MYGPAVRYKTDFQTDERECAEFLLLRIATLVRSL